MTLERQRLQAARAGAEAMAATLERQVAEMMAASETDNADDEHDPEGSTIAFERAQAASLLVVTRTRIGEIDVALQRLASGGYGVCIGCGDEIGEERLAARPSASRCVACASH